MEQRTERVRVIGESDAMRRVREEIRILGAVDATVLIEGETGTGKTLVAHAIHAASRRRDGPLVPWLDAWPSGSPSASGAVAHVPGSVGGAKGERLGPFEAALGGTLLLEEVGDMPLSMQATLLRVLEAPDLAGVHEGVPRRLDVRVLATTHRPLDREVASGRFRRDLFYRIRVARIVLPPLRKRPSDISPLALEFLRGASATYGKDVDAISAEALDHLRAHRWPGNVRELQATIEAAVIRADGRTLGLTDVLQTLAHDGESGPAVGRPSVLGHQRLLEALQRAGGNRSIAARLLGVSRSTLYRHLAERRPPDDDRGR